VVSVRIGDVVSGGRVRGRALIVQQKTKRPVQFELMDTARETMRAWLERRGGTLNDFVFPSRNDYMAHMSTRQYARLVREWVAGIWPSATGIWNALASAYEGVDHLQSTRQSPHRSDPFWSCEN
jgi:hypothetical protein